jgi:hypothetical protein
MMMLPWLWYSRHAAASEEEEEEEEVRVEIYRNALRKIGTPRTVLVSQY